MNIGRCVGISRAFRICAALLIPLMLSGSGCMHRGAFLNIRDRVIVGNELRLVIDTGIERDSFFETFCPLAWWATGSRVRAIDHYGYLVTVVLPAQEALTAQVRIFGPLYKCGEVKPWPYDVPIAFRTVSFKRIEFYTQKVVGRSQIGNEHPVCEFDRRTGDLLKLVQKPAGGYEWTMLMLTNASPRWVHVSDFSDTEWDDAVIIAFSADARYRLQIRNGKAALIDCLTGLACPDPWLDQIALDSAAIPGGASRYLSSDLRCYGLSPHCIGSVTDRLFSEFMLGGKAYRRNEVYIVWQRDQNSYRIVQKPRATDSTNENPDPDWNAFESNTVSSVSQSGMGEVIHKAFPEGLEVLFSINWASRLIPKSELYVPIAERDSGSPRR